MAGAAPAVLGKNGLYLVPGGAVDERFLLARIGDASVLDLADISAVVEQLVEHTLSKGLPRLVRWPAAFSSCTSIVADPTCRNPEDVADEGSLGLVDDQLAVAHAVTECSVPPIQSPRLRDARNLSSFVRKQALAQTGQMKAEY